MSPDIVVLLKQQEQLIADLVNEERRLDTALGLLGKTTGKKWTRSDLGEMTDLVTAPITPEELKRKIEGASAK